MNLFKRLFTNSYEVDSLKNANGVLNDKLSAALRLVQEWDANNNELIGKFKHERENLQAQVIASEALIKKQEEKINNLRAMRETDASRIKELEGHCKEDSPCNDTSSYMKTKLDVHGLLPLKDEQLHTHYETTSEKKRGRPPYKK